jgi:hypothetical protein
MVIATFKYVTGPGLFKGQTMQHVVHRVTLGSGIHVKILFQKCLMAVTDAIVTSAMSSNETKLEELVSYDHVEWALRTTVWLVRGLQMKETVSKGTG